MRDMQKRQTNRWVCVPLLGLLGAAIAGCSAPSQFVLELGADGGAVDVPLQFVPDRGLVDGALAGDVATLTDGQVVDVEHVDAQLGDVVSADAADGGELDRPGVDADDAVAVDVAQLDAMPGDVVDVQLADAGDAGVDGARSDVVDVPVVDTPPAPCRRNADCTGGLVCGFHDDADGGTQVCEPPHGPQEGEPCVRDRDCQSGFCTDIGCARPCITESDCRGATVLVDAGPLMCVRSRTTGPLRSCYPCPGCK